MAEESTIALSPGSDLRLGGSVSFLTTIEKLKGNEHPMIAIWAYQGDTLVYMQLAQPDTIFVLGGGSSDWKEQGGPAECEAFLYSYGPFRQPMSIRTLASVSFQASG